MCRHLAWLGRPRSLSALMLEPPYGLLRQSYAPRRQRRGLMNADGWGVGFHDPTGTVRRWRSGRPLWSDASFASIAPVLTSGSVLAAVRSASAGMPSDESAAAPFTDGRWLLSHNGRVDRSVLTAPAVAAESVCDSALLAATVFAAGPDRLVETLTGIAAADPDAFLSVLLTDGDRILAVSWGDELCYRESADGVLVASEPSDDEPGWIDVGDHQLIEADHHGVRVTPLARPDEPRER